MSSKWIEESEYKSSCCRCHQVIEQGQRIYWVRSGTVMCELCGSIAEHEEPEVGDVEGGVLKNLDSLPVEAGEGVIAKMMIFTARRIDSGDVADRDVTGLLKELRQMFAQLKLDYPPEPEEDDTEKSRKRRERLLAKGDFEL